MTDVEFLGPDGEPVPAEEDLLDTGPPHRPPHRRRMIGWLAAACVVLAGGGLLASLRGGGSGGPSAPTHPATVPAGSALPSNVLVFSPAATAPIVKPGTVDVPLGTPAVEVDHTVVGLVDGTLLYTSLDGRLTQSIDVGDGSTSYALAADPASHRLWTAGLEPASLDLRAFDSRTGEHQFGFGMQTTATGIAVLDGRLYVSTDSGVQRATVGGAAGDLSSTNIRGARGGIAADSTRHRLLLVDLDSAFASVRAQRTSDPRPQASATLPFGKGSVVVAGGQIWAAGYGDHGAVLARLDPTTLRVVANSPVAAQLGPGANVVGVGKHVLLVRSGSGGVGLWCVDARSGALLQRWLTVPGAVAIGPDGGYEFTSTTDPPHRLTGGSCPG